MNNENEMNQFQNSKVLIVDDVSLNLDIIGGILKEYQLELFYSTTGQNAIEIAQKELPDLILLDINMPVMDGFKVCQTLKNMENTSTIPVIFLTSMTHTESVVKGFQLGAVDYIAKPFKPEELIARVSTHLKLKKSIETITEQNKMLTDLNNEKTKLFSIIAHDLKGPFSSTLSAFDLILENYKMWDDNKKISWLEEMQKITQKTLSLLDNLLIWAGSQTGRIIFNPEMVSLEKVVSEAIVLHIKSANQKNIQIKSNINSNISIFADKNMLSTIIRNLISNGLKFSKENSSIFIDSSENEESLTVSVSDQGVGMNEEKVKKLFKIEKNQSTVGTKGERGTGLGLVLCKEFIEKHNGKIWAESSVGKGSKFIFILPKNK